MRWIAALLGTAYVAFHAVPSDAQAVCGDRAKFMALLGENYSEERVAMGLTSAGAIIEVLTSPEGTWSILLTYPAGPTCMIAAGDMWEALPLPAPGELS